MAAPVRLAIHNPFHPEAVWAERELALRMGIALEQLGWESKIISHVTELEAFHPVASLCLHPQRVPKMSAVPSLGCHWNPPELYDNDPRAWANGLSHDAYLVGSPAVAARLAHDTRDFAQPIPTLPFYPSSQGWALPPRLAEDSRFFYTGSNWDGKRYPMLLKGLADREMLALYGQADRWQHLAGAFVATLPFDGRSVMEQANLCGMGLCLHLPAHFNAGLPNMRIFELCAAGALIIADQHPFIVEHFGDNVLYVDMARGEASVADQIIAHGFWARANAGTGREMARAAQEIFLKHFSLERLFAPVPDLVGGLSTPVGQPVPRLSRPIIPASVVVPVGCAQGDGGVLSRLQALSAQTVQAREIILCGPGMEEWLAAHPQPVDLVVRVIDPDAGGDSVATIRAGLQAADQDWVICLPEGAEPFPGWLAQFRSALDRWPDEFFFTAPVLVPGPDLGREMDASVRHAQPLLDWRLATQPPLNPAGVMMHRTVMVPFLDRLARLHPAWGLARDIGCRHRARQLDRVTIRVSGDSVAPAEMLVSSDVAESSPACGNATDVPWTGHSDLGRMLVRHLSRLHRPLDFARLPPKRPCYLYGASRGGELLYFELRKWRHVEVVGFIDSNGDRQMLGLPVRTPESFSSRELEGSVIIFANQYVSACFLRLQIVFPDYWQRFELFNGYPAIYEHCAAEERVRLQD